MATSVVMPALEMAQETGKLVAWRKREGEAVSKGEPLMDVETDKAVVEVEAAADGILSGVRATQGDVVAVGQTIAWILAPGESVPADERQPAGGRHASRPAPAPDRSDTPAASPGPTDDRPRLSPRARRLAKERGVDLRGVSGSGPGGAVLATDIAAPDAPPTEDPGDIWRIMADRVTASWTAVPQFFVARDVDAAALVDRRRRLATIGCGGAEVTYTDLLTAVVARALRNHPRLNASWIEGRILHHAAVNIGIATAVDRGLVVPVIHQADRLPVRDIAVRRSELVERARTGRLRPADLAGGTFTISNLGMYHVQAFTAIVNSPQAAILAVGRIADRVVAREGQAVVRPQVSLTLSSDHRVADGARAAAFLSELAEAIEHVESILDGA